MSTAGLRGAILLITAAGVLMVAHTVRAQEASSRWTWGLAAGIPQTLAVTLERSGEAAVRGQLHAGTILFASSLGGRLMLMSSRRRMVSPYAFFGAGLFYVAEGDAGGAVGGTGYGWAGAGLRVRTGPLAWFGELGVLFGMDTAKDYDSATGAGAVGVGFGG